MRLYARAMPRRALVVCLSLVFVVSGCASAPLPPPAVFDAEPNEAADTFLVLGDSRHGFPLIEWGAEPSADERLEFARALRDERPAFVVHVGDIARTGADQGDWLDFDTDFAPLREGGVAFYSVLGNHEYYGDDKLALDNYFARFPKISRRNHYARTFRGVRLIMLDSNDDVLGKPRADRELVWLRRRLEEAHADDSIRAVLVFAHHPPYSNRVRPAESEWMRENVLSVATEYPKARALFVGHVHSYEHFNVGGLHTIVTGGAGSPLHELSDADDDDARPDLYRGPRGFHYLRVRVAERISVEAVMRREDGSWFVADRFDI